MEIENIDCPACGASVPVTLETETIECEYCKNIFKVNLEALRNGRGAPRKGKKTSVSKSSSSSSVLIVFSIFVLFATGFGYFGYRINSNRQKKIIANREENRKKNELKIKIRKIKEWKKFKLDNSEPFSISKLNKLKMVIKKLKLPLWGRKNSSQTVYLLAKLTLHQIETHRNILRKIKKYNIKYGEKINFVLVIFPIDRKHNNYGVDAMLEVLEKKGAKQYLQFYKKIYNNFYTQFRIQDMARAAIRFGFNAKKFSKLLKKENRNDKIVILSKLEDDLDLPIDQFSYVIKNTLFNTSTAISRMDYVFEHEFGKSK